MLRKKLVCRMIGHAIDPTDPYTDQCFRCGLEFDPEDPPREDLWFWLTYYEYKRRFRVLRKFRRCAHCRRFSCPGDCDIPF